MGMELHRRRGTPRALAARAAARPLATRTTTRRAAAPTTRRALGSSSAPSASGRARAGRPFHAHSTAPPRAGVPPARAPSSRRARPSSAASTTPRASTARTAVTASPTRSTARTTASSTARSTFVREREAQGGGTPVHYSLLYARLSLAVAVALFAHECAGCGGVIEEDALVALEAHWHPWCLRCGTEGCTADLALQGKYHVVRSGGRIQTAAHSCTASSRPPSRSSRGGRTAPSTSWRSRARRAAAAACSSPRGSS